MDINATMPLPRARGKDEIQIDDLPGLAVEFRQYASEMECSRQLHDQLLQAAASIDAFSLMVQAEEFISARNTMEASIRALMPIVDGECASLAIAAASGVH